MQKSIFSLLEFGLRDSSLNSIEILEDVINYAVLADRLGFKRIWLAEHHISDSLAAWYNPFPLLPLIAGMTKRIHVGIAGVQLNLHDPYNTALDFKLIANLFPGRIDLGIAGGSAPENIRDYITRDNTDFNSKRDSLVRLLTKEDELAKDEELVIPPFKGCIPEIWYLGSGYHHLTSVLNDGVYFSRSLFHGNDRHYSTEILENFKSQYFEKHKRQPKITVAIAGCCHRTDKKAQLVAENAGYHGLNGNKIIGSPERFKDQIMEMQDLYGIDEFTFLNIARLPRDRRVGIELIQKNFHLTNE